MLELTHLEREVVNTVEIHDVVLVHQGDGDGHHDVLQSEKNWLRTVKFWSGSFRPFRQMQRPQGEEEEIASFRNLWRRKRATEENVQVAWSARDSVVKRGWFSFGHLEIKGRRRCGSCTGWHIWQNLKIFRPLMTRSTHYCSLSELDLEITYKTY